MSGAITNTELAILGLIAEQPKHGYQVETDIEQRGIRQWAEIGFSSIYYVLNKLQGSGWLESRLDAESGGPARKVYRLTEAGRAVYREAVHQRLAQPRPRSGDFELGLANLPALSPAEARAALEQHRDHLRESLERVRRKWAEDSASGDDTASAEDTAGDQAPLSGLPPHVDALFSRSLHLMEAEYTWLEAYLKTLEPTHDQ